MFTINALITHYFFEISALLMDRHDVTALESGSIATLIAVAIPAALSSVGTNMRSEFNALATKV